MQKISPIRGADRLVALGAYSKLGSGKYEPNDTGRSYVLNLRELIARQTGIESWAFQEITRSALRYGPRQLCRFTVLESTSSLEESSAKVALALLSSWLCALGVSNQRLERLTYLALVPDQRLVDQGSLRHSLATCELVVSKGWTLYVGVESLLIAITAARGNPTNGLDVGNEP